MTDTPPEVMQKYRAMLLGRSPEERLKMGCSMGATAARTERCGEGLKNAVRGLQRPPNRPRRRSALCSPPR